VGQVRILIVEDEGIIARDIERQLLALGHVPAGIAASADEAVALARATSPELVLMDIHLWGPVDGIDAALRIRAELGIPCVFLTAYATDEVVARAKRAEPLGYIIKPFDEQSLRTTTEIAVHKSRSDLLVRRSEAKYRAVVESAHDAIVTLDGAGKIVGWSKAAARLFGHAEAAIAGQPMLALLPARHHAAWRARMEALLAAGDAENDHVLLELEALLAGGGELPIEVSIAGWSTEERFFTVVVRDVSARQRAERTSRLQSAALDAAVNAIIITDSEGTIEWLNPAFTALTGYTAEESIGRKPWEVVPDGLHDEAFFVMLRETLRDGRSWVGERSNRRKDSSPYVEEETITPVRNAAGEISHFVGVKRDLSGQKLLQAQLLQAQKMEVVGRLAGGVAHDFNNLLTVINGTAELVLLDLPDEHALRVDVQEIHGAGLRAARLTRQLLAFSRRQVLTPEVVDIGAHLRGTASLLRRLIGEDIELVLEAAPDLSRVLVDPGQLEQVILNLAVNARDAMPHGGKLSITARNVELRDPEVAARAGLRPGSYVQLQVTDSGTGMDAATLGHLFEPFFTTKEHGKGTGLGLATVHGVVRQSGGGILVHSELGHGASFEVFLPPAAAKSVAPAPVRGSGRGHETILVVEDEDGPRALAARMLRGAGYQVLAAGSGREALALLASHEGPVHLLFTDVVLPGMSCADLVAAVVRLCPGIKVLFTSGYPDDVRLEQALQERPDQIITKPYSVAELTGKVRSLLDEPA
jgi:PAS domain S-box-containing protein